MDRMRAWRWGRQGLAAGATMPPAEVARRFGWLRSVGSSNPYLAVHARTGAGRAEIEAAVAAVELVEVPAARGCTYYVPREDAALALGLAAMGTCRAEFRMAERHLGVTESEVAGLAESIERALEGGPLDPREIAARAAPRHLGDEGKRRGMTSALSLGLSRLQVAGRVRRLPQGGRLDTERFRYALWEDGPRPEETDETALAREMAARYFGWAGPATERQFREWAGLPARAAKEATAGLAPCPDDPSLLMLPSDVDAYMAAKPTEGRAVLLASLDPWLHLLRFSGTALEGTSGSAAASLMGLDSHPVALDGEVVGLWEFSPEEGRIVAHVWRNCEAVERAVAETSAWIAEELGDFRAFSLDGPKTRGERIERLRATA